MDEDTFPIGFARHRVALAKRLAAGECGGSYGDAVLIISSAISALAAELFPGTGIDRRRFVEVWARYAGPDLNPLRISVPLLAQSFHEANNPAAVRHLSALRPDVIATFPAMVNSLVLDGDHADASEHEVLAAAPELSLKTLRAFSYPNLFYSEIRSGFVHEGDTTRFGSRHPGGTRTSHISYANVINKPYRRIHFTVDWLCSITDSIARNAACDFYAPREGVPAAWWLDGGSV